MAAPIIRGKYVGSTYGSSVTIPSGLTANVMVAHAVSFDNNSEDPLMSGWTRLQEVDISTTGGASQTKNTLFVRSYAAGTYAPSPASSLLLTIYVLDGADLAAILTSANTRDTNPGQTQYECTVTGLTAPRDDCLLFLFSGCWSYPETSVDGVSPGTWSSRQSGASYEQCSWYREADTGATGNVTAARTSVADTGGAILCLVPPTGDDPPEVVEVTLDASSADRTLSASLTSVVGISAAFASADRTFSGEIDIEVPTISIELDAFSSSRSLSANISSLVQLSLDAASSPRTFSATTVGRKKKIFVLSNSLGRGNLSGGFTSQYGLIGSLGLIAHLNPNDYEIVALAYNNITTQGLLDLWPTEVAPYIEAGDIVILWEAVNGIWILGDAHTPAQEIEVYREIGELAIAAGAHMVVLSCLPQDASPSEQADIDEFNSLLRASYLEYANNLIDLDRELLQFYPPGNPPNGKYSDEVHLSDFENGGYDDVSTHVAPRLYRTVMMMSATSADRSMSMTVSGVIQASAVMTSASRDMSATVVPIVALAMTLNSADRSIAASVASKIDINLSAFSSDRFMNMTIGDAYDYSVTLDATSSPRSFDAIASGVIQAQLTLTSADRSLAAQITPFTGVALNASSSSRSFDAIVSSDIQLALSATSSSRTLSATVEVPLLTIEIDLNAFSSSRTLTAFVGAIEHRKADPRFTMHFYPNLSLSMSYDD